MSISDNTKVVMSISVMASVLVAVIVGSFQLGGMVRDRDGRLAAVEQKSENQQRQLKLIHETLQDIRYQSRENAIRLERIEKAVK